MNVSEDVNFSRLEKEFISAQSTDEKYTRENDAKFRAVHQKVKSYEEFRDIVAASHLCPVDMNDLSKLEKHNQPWNTCIHQMILYVVTLPKNLRKRTGHRHLY